MEDWDRTVVRTPVWFMYFVFHCLHALGHRWQNQSENRHRSSSGFSLAPSQVKTLRGARRRTHQSSPAFYSSLHKSSPDTKLCFFFYLII